MRIFLWVSMFLLMFDANFAAEDRKVLTNDPGRAEGFIDWGLGMFIHWSMDSQLGSVISHSMVGASAEYLQRYITELPASFNPERYNPDEWMQLARLSGAKYAVFTTKHHSGFCMWDSQTTEFDIASTPYKEDIVRPYVDACRKHGLKVGFYFSPEDFYFLHQQGYLINRRVAPGNISTNPDLLQYDKAQIKELLTQYGPIDVIFLDSGDTGLIAQYVHELQPHCLVTRGEMKTPEQEIPDTPMPGPWEACYTLGTQWQFKPTNEVYKSGQQLIRMLIEIRAKGGNLLINAGPQPDGIIPFEQDRRFRELGLWMFVNSEAIYGIRPCPIIREDDFWFTQSKDGDKVYVFIVGQENWALGERREFKIKSMRSTNETQISVLGQNDRAVEYKPEIDPASRFSQEEDGLKISIVRAQRLYNDRTWPNPLVVRLIKVRFDAKS